MLSYQKHYLHKCRTQSAHNFGHAIRFVIVRYILFERDLFSSSKGRKCVPFFPLQTKAQQVAKKISLFNAIQIEIEMIYFWFLFLRNCKTCHGNTNRRRCLLRSFWIIKSLWWADIFFTVQMKNRNRCCEWCIMLF